MPIKIILLSFLFILQGHAARLFIGTAQSDGIYSSELNVLTGELSSSNALQQSIDLPF